MKKSKVWVKGIDSKGGSTPSGGELTDRLTPREIDVVEGVTAAKTNGEIGSKLGIAESTVKHHLKNIFDKLGVSNRVELALRAADRVPLQATRSSRRSLLKQQPKASRSHGRHLAATRR